MTDARSIAKSETDSSLSSETDNISHGKIKSAGNKDSRKTSQRKLSANLLDSNGESEDEEINKLQKVIQDQAKELHEEKQAARKVIQFLIFFRIFG